MRLTQLGERITMGWGNTIGCVLLTALEGGALACALASFLIDYQQITSREGAAGFFAVFVTLTGLAGGFVVGLITALVVKSGFWKAQGYAAGITLALTVVAGVLAIWLDDNGPKLAGESIVTEVELKCPRGWQPDNKAKFEGSFCWIQRAAADAPSEKNPMYSGGLNLKGARHVDGQWVVPIAFDLRSTTRNRYLRAFIGNKTDVTIKVPLPRSPGAAYKEWSAWTTDGFLPQTGNPVTAGYSFRYRIQTDSEHKRTNPDEGEVFKAAWVKMLDAVPENAPMSKWLPLFEDNTGHPTASIQGAHPEVKAVNTKAEELAPLLRSTDQPVVRQAVFATATLTHIPNSLIEPLADAGRMTIDLIKAAKAGALPNDPDLMAEEKAYTFFSYWSNAMDIAGESGNQARRRTLEAIEPEVRIAAKEGGIHQIAEMVRTTLTTSH